MVRENRDMDEDKIWIRKGLRVLRGKGQRKENERDPAIKKHEGF